MLKSLLKLIFAVVFVLFGLGVVAYGFPDVAWVSAGDVSNTDGLGVGDPFTGGGMIVAGVGSVWAGVSLYLSRRRDDCLKHWGRFLGSRRLQAIEQLHAQTTPGPWLSLVEGRDHASGSSFIATNGVDIELTGASHADQDFIAEAHSVMPVMIALIRDLTRERTKAKPEQGADAYRHGDEGP